MDWMFPSVIATIGGSFMLVMVYLYLYQRDQKSYLAIWACSWSLYLIRYGFMMLIVSGYDSKVFLIGNQLSVLASGLLLVWGTYIFLEQNMPRGYLYFGGLNALWIILGIEYNFSFILLTLPTFIFLGLIYMWVGRVFIHKNKEERHHRLVGYAFILWGLHKLNYPFLRPSTWFAPWGYIIGAVLLFSVAIGMLIAYFENMSKKLVENEEKYRSMMEAIEDLVVITSPDYSIEYANTAMTNKMGRDIRGESCFRILLGADSICPGCTSDIWAAQKSAHNEVVLPDGSIYHILTSSFSRADGLVSKIHILRDITELKMVENELRYSLENLKYLSFHDKVTDLYNRAFFEEELLRLDTERQLPLSIVYIDLNGLKLNNDAFGHQEGDKLLKKLAQIFKIVCRTEDIIARVGGDEFVIILCQTNEKNTLNIISRIEEGCAQSEMEPIQLSISVGFATKNHIDENIDDIFKKAEESMYRQKLNEGRSIRKSIILSIQKMLREKSFETFEHGERMERLAVALGRKLNLSERELNELKLLATLHDIGKIGIQDRIIMKLGTLTNEEYERIKKHCEIGYHIAKSSPELGSIAEAILHHHERWDGKGYPQGIQGKEIPLLSRIISVVDTYDVITNDRPYRQTMSHEEALEEIKKCAGDQFDSEIVRAFIEMMQ